MAKKVYLTVRLTSRAGI